MVSKYILLGVSLQVFIGTSILLAHDGLSQTKSLNDIYITIKLQDVRLAEALEMIGDKTNFSFTFNGETLDKDRRISVRAENNSLASLLKDVSKYAAVKFKRVNGNIYVSRKTLFESGVSEIIKDTYLLEKEISGKISDERGEGLPGANVVVKGTNIGVVTDADGLYRISVPDDAKVLVLSYVGYVTEEVAIAGRSVVDFSLTPDISSLAEIIVTGYSEKDKRKLTSSVATVSGEQIEQVPMSTFDNILQGTAPGLLVQSGNGQPGSSASVTIRGTKSINSSSQPLYILDGIAITSDDFSAINPNDIASVSVLKDAAATQIYGSRGATGVIVITTKSGEKGKTKFEYHAQAGISLAPEYTDELRPLTSAELIDLEQELGLGGTVGLPQEALDSLKNINTDWLDVLTRDAFMQSHELNISGGNENTKFFISGSYFSQEGTSIRSKLDRYSVRTKIDYQKNNISFGTNFYASYSRTNDVESEGSSSRSNPFYGGLRLWPYNHAIDPRTGDFALPLDIGASTTWNALERIRTNDEKRSIAKAIIGVTGKYDLPFLEGLSVSTLLNMDFRQRERIDYIDPNSFRGPRSPGGQGELSQFFGRRVRFTVTNAINYNFNIGDDHQFNTSLYQEFLYATLRETDLTVFGLDRIKTIAGATQGTPDNGFIPEFDGGTAENSLSSYFATVDYSFKDRYNVTLGVRRDGSSRFGERNRYGTFYSIGTGWIISDENFMVSQDFVNYLKLRASYGTVGNQSIPNNAVRSIFSPTTYNGQAGLFSGLSNPDLKWEETEKFNLGLDFTLLDGFLTASLDVYNEKTNGLFLDVPITQTSGFSEQLRNVGSLRNRGIELFVSTRNIHTDNFEWETSLNIAHNKTVVLKLFNGESFTTSRFLVEEGKEFGLFYMPKRAGVNPANGRFLWYDKNGGLTETYDFTDAVDHGPSAPRVHGGFTNTLTYKGFRLRVLLTYALGHEIYNVSRVTFDNPVRVTRGSVSNNALRFWRQPGDITDIPDPFKVTSFERDSGLLEDASYMKVRNVVLSYNLPSSLVSRLKIGGLRVFLQGQNIYTFTSFTGLDPENSSTAFSSDYPSLSSYTLGVDVNF